MSYFSTFNNIVVVEVLKNIDQIIVKQIPFTHKKVNEEYLNRLLIEGKDYIPDGVNMINAPFMWSD